MVIDTVEDCISSTKLAFIRIQRQERVDIEWGAKDCDFSIHVKKATGSPWRLTHGRRQFDVGRRKKNTERESLHV